MDAAFQYVAVGFRAFAAESGAISAGLVNGQLESPFVAHDIGHDGLVYQDDHIRVTAAENSHYALMPAPARQQVKSYSYRIETPHGIVAFTGDTGPSDAVVRLAQGADVLVTEVEDLDEISRFVENVAAQNHSPAQRAAALMAHMRQEHLDLRKWRTWRRRLGRSRSCSITTIPMIPLRMWLPSRLVSPAWSLLRPISIGTV